MLWSYRKNETSKMSYKQYYSRVMLEWGITSLIKHLNTHQLKYVFNNTGLEFNTDKLTHAILYVR